MHGEGHVAHVQFSMSVHADCAFAFNQCIVIVQKVK